MREHYDVLGLSRLAAAKFLGVGTTKFDELVRDGIMPEPRQIGGRVVWDRREIVDAFDRLPRRNASAVNSGHQTTVHVLADESDIWDRLRA